MNRVEKAREYFGQGYACSQAVALAFADLTGIGETELAKVMLPFGGGLGRQHLTCGAVSGMAAVVGCVFAEAEATNENKLANYAIVRELCDAFKAQHGSLICADLLQGKVVSHEPGQKHPCEAMVCGAAQILEDYLIEKGII